MTEKNELNAHVAKKEVRLSKTKMAEIKPIIKINQKSFRKMKIKLGTKL